MKSVGRLHVITDTEHQDRYDHVELARRALAGGADVIQYRAKHDSTRAMIATARAIGALCYEHDARLIVNDRLDVALAADAGGVHLGQEDFPVRLARELLGPDRLIGASAATVAEAEEAAWAGADYLGVGAVYATDRKADAGEPIGTDGLRAIAAAVEIPVIAIGGVTGERLPAILGAGAHGVAVIQAVSLAPDPEAAARALWEQLTEGRDA